jgi:2-succinyl-6-hydroxy-2,4-cyclohexadiene-1-carboxylate synthase
VAPQLAAACQAEVLTPDLPGHGSAAASRPAGLAEAASSLGETAGPGIYVGYSMGARVCLRLALDRPALVERLVLVGATPGLADDGERAARQAADEALAERVEQIGLEDFLEEWLAGPLFAHLTAEQAGRQARLENTTTGLAFALRRLGTAAEPSLWPRLSELTMPVLLVAGERDEKFTRLAYQMSEVIGPNAEVAALGDAGHAAPFEQPSGFATILAMWLAASPPGGRATVEPPGRS